MVSRCDTILVVTKALIMKIRQGLITECLHMIHTMIYDTVSQTLGRDPFVGHGSIFMGPLIFCFLHFVLEVGPKKATIFMNLKLIQ